MSLSGRGANFLQKTRSLVPGIVPHSTCGDQAVLTIGLSKRYLCVNRVWSIKKPSRHSDGRPRSQFISKTTKLRSKQNPFPPFLTCGSRPRVGARQRARSFPATPKRLSTQQKVIPTLPNHLRLHARAGRGISIPGYPECPDSPDSQSKPRNHRPDRPHSRTLQTILKIAES